MPPRPLFAVCLSSDGPLAKRVKLDGELQGQIEGLFDQQCLSFTEDIDEEISFTRDYKPDPNELLTVSVDAVPGASLFRETVEQSATAIEEMGARSLMHAGVKALFIGSVDNGAEKILVQKFTRAQALDRKFMVFLVGDVYRRLTDTVFSLETALTFIIEDGLIKFRNFNNLRSILDVQDLYRSATDAEVHQFAGHDSFEASDVENFMGIADQVSRKSIGSILDSGVLDLFTPTDLKEIAASTGLEIELEGSKIALPNTRRKLKELLYFLTEQRFIGLLSGKPFIANSVRPAQPSN